MTDASRAVEHLSNLSVLEAAELSKLLEAKWGVRAAVPIAQKGFAEAAIEFDVILSAYGEKKINVMKEIRTITGLGLREVKDLVESAPTTVKDNLNESEANSIKDRLEKLGAIIEIRPSEETRSNLYRVLRILANSYTEATLESPEKHLNYLKGRLANIQGVTYV